VNEDFSLSITSGHSNDNFLSLPGRQSSLSLVIREAFVLGQEGLSLRSRGGPDGQHFGVIDNPSYYQATILTLLAIECWRNRKVIECWLTHLVEFLLGILFCKSFK
jgi:hypothetical protein